MPTRGTLATLSLTLRNTRGKEERYPGPRRNDLTGSRLKLDLYLTTTSSRITRLPRGKNMFATGLFFYGGSVAYVSKTHRRIRGVIHRAGPRRIRCAPPQKATSPLSPSPSHRWKNPKNSFSSVKMGNGMGIVLLSAVLTLCDAGVKRQTQEKDPDRIIFEDELQNIIERDKTAPQEATPPPQLGLGLKTDVFINGQYVNSERYTTTELPSAQAPSDQSNGTETEIGWINHSTRKHLTVDRHKSRFWHAYYLQLPSYFPAVERAAVPSYPWYPTVVDLEPITLEYYHVLSKRSAARGHLTFPGETTNRPQSCTTNCPTTPEYNPVCGDDAITYTNPGKLHCTVWCGKRHTHELIMRVGVKQQIGKDKLCEKRSSYLGLSSPALSELIGTGFRLSPASTVVLSRQIFGSITTQLSQVMMCFWRVQRSEIKSLKWSAGALEIERGDPELAPAFLEEFAVLNPFRSK
ncbi:hypothetical protein AAG570_012713 [Ranatra chinensis]|uniref:Kazal-like domain-containing protein n=1 Tax=Ranatra chinensis TaxID=642074 RepID=A0ABD0YGL9_9HEMI